jgi:hypothetical protein
MSSKEVYVFIECRTENHSEETVDHATNTFTKKEIAILLKFNSFLPLTAF